MSLGSIFKDIGKGLLFIPKEIAHLIVDLGEGLTKLIVGGHLVTVAEDGSKVITDAGKELVTLAQDTVSLNTAVAKDDGASLAALERLVAAIAAAASEKGVNLASDGVVVARFEAFVDTLDAQNFTDVLTAWSKLLADGKSLSSAVVADLTQLTADATSSK